MNIGCKIKNARLHCGLTQEQAADFLNVSRQTVSNWENNKTYPDIVSVIKMSDLYNISLDKLLKEEPPVSDYLNYLEESTNTVKCKNRLSAFILISVYLGIWAVSLILFWCLPVTGNEIGYCLMFQWILLPVTTFVISLMIGKNYHSKKKWFSAVLFGIMHMLSEYATFSMANMIEFKKINMPDFKMMTVGTVVSLIGLGIGAIINYFRHYVKNNS